MSGSSQTDLAAEVLRNRFAVRLRTELMVDEAEYDRLRALLARVADVWRSTEALDKELVRAVYSQVSAVAPMADYMSSRRHPMAARAREIAVALEEGLMDALDLVRKT